MTVRGTDRHGRIRTAVSEDTQSYRILTGSSRDRIFGSSIRLEIEGIGNRTCGSDGNERITIRPLRTRCLYIYIVRSIPAMIRLQHITVIAIGRYSGLVHNRIRSRVGRIHLRICDKHVIGRSIALPRDIGIGVTRINRYVCHFIDRLPILNRQIIDVEQIIPVKITNESHICSRTGIRTEVNDILYKSLVSPNAYRVNGHERSNIIGVIHHTYNDTTPVLASRMGIYRAPEMHLALINMEILLGRIRQSRSSHIDITVCRNKSRRRTCCSTGEDQRCRRIRRVIGTGVPLGRRVDIRIRVAGVVSPIPISIAHYTRSIVECLGKRHLFRSADTETERTFFRCFTTPCTFLFIA